MKIDNILSQNGERKVEFYQWETAEEMNKKLADRVSQIRKRRKISQKELSEKSGVSLGSVKRFETSGQISLISLTKIAIALGCSNEITEMFVDVPYRNIEEVISDNR